MDDPTREPVPDATSAEVPTTASEALAGAEADATGDATTPVTVPAPSIPPPPADAWASTEGPSAAAPPPPTAWEGPEEVVGPAPGYAFGGAGERLIAYIVDGILISLIGLVGFVVGTGLVLVFWPLGLIVYLVTPLICLSYFPWFWHRTGQTPGLRMFGLRVVRDHDGGPISVGAAMLRLVGYWINSIVFYIGFIWIFIDKRKRCWHDLIAGTVVIKRL